jgi:hypothetical protein
MPFKTNWIASSEATMIKNTDRDIAIATLGHIIPYDNEGSVEVMLDLFFDEEARALVTYILQNIDGQWQITEFGGMG